MTAVSQFLVLRRASAQSKSACFAVMIAAFSCIAPPSALAQAMSPSPLAAAKSQPSIISAGGPKQGVYHVAMDIKLSPGVLTYWRFPGDAGVPPTFSFAGSENIASEKVSYPAPSRIVEDGATAFGYRGEVLFPIAVTPENPGKPSRLQVRLNYATCDTICVPAETVQTIELSPAAGTSPDASRIAAWQARVPAPLPAKLRPSVSLAGAKDKPTWRLSFPKASPSADLFVEGPDGWFFDSKASGSGVFDVVLAQAPEKASLKSIPVRLTYVDGSHAYDDRISLDGAKR